MTHFDGMIKELEQINRRPFTPLQRLALVAMLGKWPDPELIPARIAELLTKQDFITVADLNPERPKELPKGLEEWREQWLIVKGLYAGGERVDFGSERSTQAARVIRETLRIGSETEAMWAFRDAYEALTAEAIANGPALAAGSLAAQLGIGGDDA